MSMIDISPCDGIPRTDGLLGPFLQEADAFLRTQIDQETYQKIMGHEAGRAHPYVAARIVMDNEQWEKYLWISHHGSLASYG